VKKFQQDSFPKKPSRYRNKNLRGASEMNTPKIIEQNGAKVLTTTQLAEAYGTDSERITKNFNRNKERYKENKHFICLEGDSLKEFRAKGQIDLSLNINRLYLWTEKGAWLHAKSLNTDQAWEAYEMLVDEYYRMMSSQFQLPSSYKEALLQLVEQVEKTERLELANAQKEQIIHELQPKATYYDLVLQNKSLLSISKISKDYGFSGKSLNKILHELGVQFKQGDCWLLYQKYADKGYTQSKTHALDAEKSKLHTYWTQKGRLFIYEILKNQKGILPIIEQEMEPVKEIG
jgi:phage antirepressor YoqD-like protein